VLHRTIEQIRVRRTFRDEAHRRFLKGRKANETKRFSMLDTWWVSGQTGGHIVPYLTLPSSIEYIPLSLINSPRHVNPSLGEYLSFSYNSTVSRTELGSGNGSLIGWSSGGTWEPPRSGLWCWV
jgi:hypothetical protein